jgi:hypothetical protein
MPSGTLDLSCHGRTSHMLIPALEDIARRVNSVGEIE